MKRLTALTLALLLVLSMTPMMAIYTAAAEAGPTEIKITPNNMGITSLCTGPNDTYFGRAVFGEYGGATLFGIRYQAENERDLELPLSAFLESLGYVAGDTESVDSWGENVKWKITATDRDGKQKVYTEGPQLVVYDISGTSTGVLYLKADTPDDEKPFVTFGNEYSLDIEIQVDGAVKYTAQHDNFKLTEKPNCNNTVAHQADLDKNGGVHGLIFQDKDIGASGDALYAAPAEERAVTLGLTAAPTTVAPGAQALAITVTASGIAAEGANGWQFGVTYNTTAFEFVSASHAPGVEASNVHGFASTDADTYGAPLTVGCALGGGKTVADGETLAVLTFRVKEDAENSAYTFATTSDLKGDSACFYLMVSGEPDPTETDYTITNGEVSVTVQGLTHVEAKDATCEEPGNKEYYTDGQGNYYLDAAGSQPTTLEEVTIPATGHTPTHHEAVPPTCTEAGTIEYWECSVCGKYFRDADTTDEIADKNVTDPAKGHTLAKVEATEPTATEPGYKEHWKCSVCEKLFEDELGERETTLESLTIPPIGSFALTLTPNRAVVNAGETFTVTLRLSDIPASGAAGWDIALTYPDSVELLSAENGTSTEGKILGVLNKESRHLMGTVTGLDGSGVVNLKESTDIATLTFRASDTVLSSGEAEITASIEDIYYINPDLPDNNEITSPKPAVEPATVHVSPVVPHGSATLTVGSVSGDIGDTVEVTIDLTENTGLSTALLRVAYDAGLTLTGITNGSILTAEGGAAPSWSTAPEDFAKNPYTVLWDGDLSETTTATGTLVTLTFKISDEAELGDTYTVRVLTDEDNCEVYTKDLVPVDVTATPGEVTVACTKIDADGEWNYDAATHYHEDVHGHKFDIEEHRGGTADCQHRAVCEVCGQSYGELGPHKLTLVPAKLPTTTEEGNLAYYRCEICGKLFKDAEGLIETTRDEVILPPIEALLGDVNSDGLVDDADRLALSHFLAGWQEQLDIGINEQQSDVNMDGKVTTLDRMILARYLAQWDGYDTLPPKFEGDN